MTQDYDLFKSANTSPKSVSNLLLPSRKALRNVQSYARHAAMQYVNVKEVTIKICLN